MKRWIVYIPGIVAVTWSHTVEANNKEEALVVAREAFHSGKGEVELDSETSWFPNDADENDVEEVNQSDEEVQSNHHHR